MLVHTYYKILTGWQLRGLLFIISASFLICAPIDAHPQTPLFQIGHELSSANNKTLIGQQLWFVPDLTETLRIGFAKSTKHEDLIMRKRLYPTDTVKMQVVEKVYSGTKIRKIHSDEYYRIMFDDGSSAFIEVWMVEHHLSEYTSNTITEKNLGLARICLHIQDSFRPPFSEKFLKDDPVRIKKKIDELVTAIENRRKKRQERGGILVGMTKAQVLSSSWGKPIEVNTTIVKGVVSEQWVYPGHNYLYFDNDRLTAIQTSK